MMRVVSKAVRTLEASGQATAGYGLDLGVLSDGETALVEWNDGFSLGSYGLDASLYAELILARWRELVDEAAISAPASFGRSPFRRAASCDG